MNVFLLTVPHRNQRYDTCGDWHGCKGFGPVPAHDAVLVSDMGDPDSELLVALHELFEMHLCRRDGVAESDVDAWDMSFTGAGEPGAALGCPYARQHELAERLERFAAGLLGVDWAAHERKVDALGGER